MMKNRQDDINDARERRGRTLAEQLEVIRASLDALENTFGDDKLGTLTEPPIDEMLKWQAECDAMGIGINLRGSARFWNTVQYHTDCSFSINGAPEFSQIIVPLADDVGLVITAGGDYHEGEEPENRIVVWLKARFAKIEYKPYGYTLAE